MAGVALASSYIHGRNFMKRRKTIRIGRSAKTGRFTTVKRARRYKSTHVVVRIRRAC